jgi:hypothetical protein
MVCSILLKDRINLRFRFLTVAFWRCASSVPHICAVQERRASSNGLQSVFQRATGFPQAHRRAVSQAAGRRAVAVAVAGAKSEQITTAQPAVDCPVDQKQIAFVPVNLVKHLELDVDNDSDNGCILSVCPRVELCLAAACT